MTTVDAPLLRIAGLKTHFNTHDGLVRAVDGVDLAVRPGRTLCVVGESGSGKSVMAKSILRIVEPQGQVVGGEMLLRLRSGQVVDTARLDPRGEAIRAIRGREVAMIFQEPMNSLSPVHTIGAQIIEKIVLHFGVSRREAADRAAEALDRVGIPNPRARLSAYPFELSGGMRQRGMIAMALSCRPAMLIADEPTTALDVTTQANILALIKDLQRELGMAVMFITHDLGVVAEIADEVAVMYLGNVVERGTVDQIFYEPQHPYTMALLRSIPKIGARRIEGGRLQTIAGMVPHPLRRPSGCPFNTRCTEAIAGLCNRVEPAVTDLGGMHTVSCHLREAA